MTGDLTIKGVTRPVTVDFEYTGTAVDPYGNTRVGFEGQTTINRKDWGVNWNAALETDGVLVSEKVTLEFEISAIRTSDARTRSGERVTVAVPRTCTLIEFQVGSCAVAYTVGEM